MAGTVKQFAAQAEHFAQSGMVAVVADYRVQCRDQSTPFDSLEDARAAIRWMRRNANTLGIDTDRIAVGGGSAGGHLALSTAVIGMDSQHGIEVDSKPNALILFNPGIDLAAPYAAHLIKENFGESVLERSEEISPMAHVLPGLPPLLILNGKADTNTPYDIAERFCEKVNKLGDRCELVGYDGAEHGFFNSAEMQVPASHGGKWFEPTLAEANKFLRQLGYLEPSTEGANTDVAGNTSTASTIDDLGTVHLPAFSVPLSRLTSAAAKASILEKERVAQTNPAPDSGMEQARTWWNEVFLKPQIATLRQAFPVKTTRTRIGGIDVDLIEPEAGIAAGNRNKVLINIHGGGFVTAAGFGGLAESIPIAVLGKIKVVAVDYRLAPEHKFPAAVEDVAAVYEQLLKSYRPENIGVYGCSSGGMTSAHLIPFLEHRGLPTPGAIGIFCAGAIASADGDSFYIGSLVNWRQPPRPIPASARGADMLNMYFGAIDVKDPATSPAYSQAALKHFPPTLIIASTRDPQLSNAIYTHRQFIKAGVDADLQLWEGLGHGFFAQPWSNMVDPDVPEIREAWDVIVDFFKRKLGTRAR